MAIRGIRGTTGTRNRPSQLGRPLFERGAAGHRYPPLSLQVLSERAFVNGLTAPDQRPACREWADSLGNALDELYACVGDISFPSRAGQPVPSSRLNLAAAGHVGWDAVNRHHTIVPDVDAEWTVRSPDGAVRLSARRGQALPLVGGYFIRFGVGGRMGVVIP